MDKEAREEGVDLEAVEKVSAFFRKPNECLHDERLVEPKRYEEPGVNVDPWAVRLVAFPLDSTSPLGKASLEAAHEAFIAAREASPDSRLFLQRDTCLHTTVFFLSLDKEKRLLPSPSDTRGEIAVVSRISGQTPRPILRPERLMVTRQGVMVLCLVDETDATDEMRSELRRAFPDAPTRQPRIVHASLLRICSPNGAQEAADAARRVCDTWTEAIRSLPPLCPTTSWWDCEFVYSTLVCLSIMLYHKAIGSHGHHNACAGRHLRGPAIMLVEASEPDVILPYEWTFTEEGGPTLVSIGVAFISTMRSPSRWPE